MNKYQKLENLIQQGKLTENLRPKSYKYQSYAEMDAEMRDEFGHYPFGDGMRGGRRHKKRCSIL